MSGDIPLKAAVTVAEMARMCGLSRARFYQLQKAGVFPVPQVNPSTKRPFYDQELQKVCLEVGEKTAASTARWSCSMLEGRRSLRPRGDRRRPRRSHKWPCSTPSSRSG